MLRRLIAILILLTVAAACIGVDASIALSPDQLALRLRNETKHLLSAPLDFESVRFSFSDGLKVRDVRIGGSGQPAIAARSVTVHVDIWRQEITKIVVKQPEIFLRVSPDGSTNFDNLLAPRPEEAPPPAPGRLPTIEVTDGKITVEVALAPDDVVKAVLYGIEGALKPAPDSDSMTLSMLMQSRELGKISAWGQVSHDFKNARLALKAREVDIGTVAPSLPRDGRKILNDLQLEGKVNLHARVGLTGGSFDFEAAAESLGCTVKYVELPAPVEDIRGTVKVSRDAVQLVGFTGRTHGNPVSLRGTIEFGGPALKIELDILAKDLKASDELLEALPEGERKIVREFNPRGSADIAVHVVKDISSEKPTITVQVDARGKASISYFEFPYRLENLTGTLSITPEKVEIRNVTSVTGNQTVAANGCLIPSKEGVEVDVQIKGSDIRIDGKLREALAEEDREAWDVFNPSGTANLEVKITSPADDEEVSVGVDVLLDGFASVTPTPFPLEISGITGTFSMVPEGGVHLSNIRGLAAGGHVRVTDTVIPPGEKSEAAVYAVFSGVRLATDVIKALGAAMEENLEELSAGGSVSGEIHLRRAEGSEDFALSGTVSLKDGWLVHKSFPVRAENLEALLFIKPEGYFLRSLTGEVARGKLEAWGELLEQPDGKQKLRMRMEGFNVLADNNLRNALPEDLLSTWDDFQPYGRADAAVWLDGEISPQRHGEHGEKNRDNNKNKKKTSSVSSVSPWSKIRKVLKLRLRNVSGKYVEFPYPVSGVAGDVRIDIDTGSVEIKNLRTSDGRLDLSGSVVPQGQRTITDLHVKVHEITLDRALRDAMPDEIKSLWQDIELEGVTSGTVKLHLDQLGEADPAVGYDILLRPVDAQAEAGFPLRKLRGKVTLKGNITPGGEHTLERGLIQLSNFTINGLPITWASAPVKLTEKSVMLEPITGRMASGTVSGMLKVLFDKDTSYSGRFEVKDASVRQAAEELFGEDMEKTTGRANAWVRFQGKGSDDSALRGKGEVTLLKSNLWEVPFFSELISTLSFGALPRVDFKDSFAHFRIEGDKLNFSKAYFHSSVMNLDGAGTLHLDGRLNFIFKVSLLTKAIPIPLVKNILAAVEGEINAVRATGTARKVTITLAPKKVLEAIELFEKSGEDK